MPQIIVKCPNSIPAYVRITVLEMLGAVMVERGEHDNCRFIPSSFERIQFEHDPELTGLFVNDAWDLEKLAALADFYCVEEDSARTTDEDARAAVE